MVSQISMANQRGFYLFNLGLDLPLTTSSPIFIHISGLTSDCHLFKFSFFYLDLLLIASFSNFHLFIWTYSLSPVELIFIIFIWTYFLSPVELIFIFSSGLTLYRQSSSFSYFHLDLLSIASQTHFHHFFTHLDLLSIASRTHFHIFIWTYSLLPVLQIFIFLSGLTLNCQFFSSLFFLPGLTSECQFFSIFLTWTYL